MIAYKELVSRIFDRSHLRRNLIVGVGLLTLLAVVLFNPSIQNLLNKPFGSRAALDGDDFEKVWESVEREGGTKAAHSKMTILAKDGRAWIYVAGGVQVGDNFVDGRKTTEVIKSVRRLEIDPVLGKPLTTNWETLPDFNFGRMEFGFVEQGTYLYAIAGDMHYPPSGYDPATQSALIYSTIERIKIDTIGTPGAKWEVFAKLSGVNYYPEVAATTNGIHVVGGVYGYPFPPLTADAGLADNMLDDVINQDGDTRWEDGIGTGGADVKDLPVIGKPGLTVPRGGINSPILTGGGITNPPGGTGTGGTGTGGGTNPDPQEQEGILRSQGEVLSDLSIQSHNGHKIDFGMQGGEEYIAGTPNGISARVYGGTLPPDRVGFSWRPRPQDDWIPIPPADEFGDPNNIDHYYTFSVPWQVPGGYDTNTAQFLAYAAYDGGNDLTEVSPEFSIVTHTLNMLTPRGGEFLNSGDTFNITWNHDGVPKNKTIFFYYSTDGGSTWKPANNAQNYNATTVCKLPSPEGDPCVQNSFDWIVPNEPSQTVKLRMQFSFSNKERDAWDESPNFTIIGGGIPSDKLSEALVSGEFVTTVSEHYFISIVNDNYVESSTRIGELASDYKSATGFSTRWEIGKVSAIGHLRFLVLSDSSVVPVPQGRYGHKLISVNNSFYVFGGASWAKELSIKREGSSFVEHFKTFWVVDNANHPVYRDHNLEFKYGKVNYEYIGNIAYRWDGSKWLGVNEDAINTKNFSGQTLNNDYSFKLYDEAGATTARGRAFYGLATTDLGTMVAVAGLQNKEVTTPGFGGGDFGGGEETTSDFQVSGGYFRVYVEPVETTELFNGTSWTKDQPYKDGAVYNISSSSLSGGGLFYSGQKSFQAPLASSYDKDPHVPDYTKQFSLASYIYVPSDGGNVDRWRAHPTPGMKVAPALFAATASGVFGGGNNKLTTAYHYGGFDSETLQYVGPFGTEPDPKDQRIATLTLSPTIVAPDDADYSIATITLKNGLGEPVSEHNGDKWQVTLNSNRGGNGSFSIVDNLGGYRTGKVERAIAYLSEEVPAHKDFVYLDELGTAKFKIYSNTATPANTPAILEPIFQTDSIGQKFPASAPLTVAYQADVPSHRLSTIVGDPNPVAADDTTTSVVTVTLKNYLGAAIVGYHVNITSDRNVGDGIIDTITNNAPGSFITNAQGQAKFKVKSAVRGDALIRAYFGKDANELRDNPRELTPTLTLQFRGFITSLVPDQAKQGYRLPSIEASGSQTNWIPNVTKVAFTPPQIVDFDRTSGVIIPANGGGVPIKYAVLAPQYKNKKVTLTISPANLAVFHPEGGSSATRTLDNNGRGEFYIRSGVTVGLVKIKAQIEGLGSPSAELSIMLTSPGVKDTAVDVYATPSILETNGSSSIIRAGIYEYDANGNRTHVTTPLNFQFYKDDLGAFYPSSGQVSSVDGVATMKYTRDAKSGTTHIIAVVSYKNKTFAGLVKIHKINSNEGITWNPAYTLGGDPQGAQTLTINSTTPDASDAVVIANNAEVGVWTFVTETTSDDVTESYSHPFTVLPIDYIGGPRIVDITPLQGLRGAQNLSVTIKGAETSFRDFSNIKFTALDGSSAGVTIVEGSKSAPDYETLNFKINIANDAAAGFWNVTVTTPQSPEEVAELNGPNDEDFLITTSNNIIVDVLPNPMIIPRDGRATSQITVFVGRLDPLSGKITKLPNVVVKLALLGGDLGKLNPLDDDAQHPGRKTNSEGLAFTTYTTDAGTDAQLAKISATVVVDGVTASNFGLVGKKVNENNNVVLTATPNTLPLTGGTANLEVIVKDSHGNFVRPGTPVEFYLMGNGSITPLRTQVVGNAGKATAIYTIGQQTLPQTIHIFALATIDGDGIVLSNEALITVGLDASKYRVILTANPTSIAAGGTQASTITAKLVYRENGNDSPVPNWPMNFAISLGNVGDYLTTLSGKTNANGELTTKFYAGLVAGNAKVVAQPMAIPWAEIGITKTADQTISATLSTISTVPKYIPADNTAFTVVTVTLKNSRNVAISGKTVTLTSSVGTIFPSATAVTNFNGIAKFNIKSSTVGTASVAAKADNVTLTTQAIFVAPGELVPVDLNVIVPLEAKSYDRLVRLFLRQPADGQFPVIDEVYVTDSTDHVLDLPTIYLKPSTEYKFWAKGKNHLARVKPVTATGRNLEVNFMGTYKNRNIGLPIGDIAPDEGGSAQGLFHDNAINAVDFAVLTLNWFKNSYIADFTSDGMVNILEYVYWVNNYGSGDPLP